MPMSMKASCFENQRQIRSYRGLAPVPGTRLTGCRFVPLSYPVATRTGNSPRFLLPYTTRCKAIAESRELSLPGLRAFCALSPAAVSAVFARCLSLSPRGMQPAEVPRAGPDLFSPCDLSRPRPHRLRDTRAGGDRSLLKPFCSFSLAAVSALNCISLSVRFP